jgi:16S rRNA U1498 N3-methylase RsmE
MNLILLFPDDFVDGTGRARVHGRRLRHVLNVHRATIDDELCVGLAGGRIGTGRVISLSTEFICLRPRCP